MDENALRYIAQQLRRPEGKEGRQFAENMNKSNALINIWAIEQLEISSNDTVLEIGMGNGAFVGDLMEKYDSIRYAGCDFSETMVREATKRNTRHVLTDKVSFHMADARNLPFGDHTFDKAFCVNTIYFWEDPGKELSEIKRVLRKGGKLSIAIRSRSSMEQLPFTKYGFELYDKSALTSLLLKSGFRPVSLFEHLEPDVLFGNQHITMETIVGAFENR